MERKKDIDFSTLIVQSQALKNCICHLSCARAPLHQLRERLTRIQITQVQSLTLFPGSRAWAEKKEPGTHCLRMLSFPRISGNLEISRKTCSVTLTWARHTDFSRIKDAATDYALCERWRGSDEGTRLFASRNCPPVRPLQLNASACDWRNLSLWTSPITSNEAMQTVTVKAILFFTSKSPVSVPQGL